MMATGGTKTARVSRATGGTSLQDDSKGQWQQGDRRHDDSDGRHDDGRQDDGKGRKEAAAPPPPPAYKPQHHRENVYQVQTLGLI